MPGPTFGAEEEAHAWRYGYAPPAPPTVVGAARAVVQARINAATLVSNQQRMMASDPRVRPQAPPGYRPQMGQVYIPPLPPREEIPPPKPTLRPVGGAFGDVIRDLTSPTPASPVNLFNFGLPEEQVTKAIAEEKKAREKRIETGERSRYILNEKTAAIREVEQKLSKDANAPEAERAALQLLKRRLIELPESLAKNQLNPILVQVRNLGTRAQYRIELADWKQSKKGGVPYDVPMALPSTSEEFDQMGGLGGFLAQGQAPKNANDFDRTPPIFGKLITRDADGVEHIIGAMEWISAKIADTKPLPSDSPEVRARKARMAADLMATLAATDKYNSFAQKRDAGYRIQLDSQGRPVAGYLLKPDEDALKNLVAEIMTDMATHNIVGPVEDWIEAYALERDAIGDVATGVYGDGSSSGSGGYGYSRGSRGGYGGYGGGGGGQQITTYFPTDAEVVEPANGVARARLGRSLSADEEKEFVAFFRSIEAAVLGGGGALSRVDPQAQAIAWLESRMSKEAAGQQAGRYFVALMQMLRSGIPNVG